MTEQSNGQQLAEPEFKNYETQLEIVVIYTSEFNYYLFERTVKFKYSKIV